MELLIMATKITTDRPKMGYCTYWGSSVKSRNEIFLIADIVRTGSPVVAWRSKIASLQNASSNYQVRGRKLDTSSGSISSVFKNRTTGALIRSEISGNWLTTPGAVAFPGHDSAAIGQGTGKYYSKVADALAPFKGFVFIGELKESLTTVGTLALGLLRSYRSTRNQVAQLIRAFVVRFRGRRRKSHHEIQIGLEELIRKIADLWLLWSFSVAPILSDIESAAEAYFRPLVEVRRCKCRSASGVTKISDSSGVGVLPNCNDTYKVRSWQTRETTCRFSGAVMARYPGGDSPLKGTAARYGLTFREFVPSLWELTPWSFLVDYFVNVQQVLNAVAYHDAEHVYSVQTVKTVQIWTVVANALKTGGPPNGYARESGPSGGHYGRQTAFQLDRSQIAITNVRFVVSYPPLGLKWANMLALAISKLSKPLSIKLL